jgi:hypothetical protein
LPPIGRIVASEVIEVKSAAKIALLVIGSLTAVFNSDGR